MKAVQRDLIGALIVYGVMLYVGQVSNAGQLEDGINAYNRGDDATAVRLWRPLAEHGDASAQYDMAFAVKWWRPLAERGDPEAQYYMAIAAHDGLGRKINLAEAAAWLKKSADAGFGKSQFQYGLMLWNGQGVSKNLSAAETYFERAAEQGKEFSAGAMHNLGVLNEESGHYEDAYMWYELAIHSGANYSKAFQDRLPRFLSSLQIAKARQSAAAWETTHSVAFSHVTTVSPRTAEPVESAPSQSIPMRNESGTYVVPVLINDAITLAFVVDSGASDVSIPADVVLTLIRTGTLTDADFIGTQIYKTADGRTIPSSTFRIRSLKVGDRVVENVTGSVAPLEGDLLLGQSFLGRFKSWSIDNATHSLVLRR